MASPTDISLDGWKKRWVDGQTGWHVSEEHNLFTKYFEQLCGEKQKLKIFFPLCGKTVDMKMLSDRGHHVVGVDVSPVAAEQFFKENNMEYSTTALTTIEGTVFQNKEGNMKIYACSFYDFNNEFEGEFDVIWDRMSFVAINLDERSKYVNAMKTLLSTNVLYLLQLVEYDDTIFKGPPRIIKTEEIEDVLKGTDLIVNKKLEKALSQIKGPKRVQELGLAFYETLYLLTKQKTV